MWFYCSIILSSTYDSGLRDHSMLNHFVCVPDVGLIFRDFRLIQPSAYLLQAEKAITAPANPGEIPIPTVLIRFNLYTFIGRSSVSDRESGFRFEVENTSFVEI